MRRKKIQTEPVIVEERIEEYIEVRPSIVKTIVIPFGYGFLMALIIFVGASKLFGYIKKNPAVKKASPVKVRNLSKNQIKEALERSIGVYIDPMEMAKLIDTKASDIVILDTRDKSEYEKGHIKGAVMELKETKNKMVIVYGRTGYDANPKEIALGLLEKGLDVKVLSIGWNEFRHFRNLWVPDSMWGKFDPEKYIGD